MESARLISKLSSPRAVRPPVVLPDFFVDHFVKVESLEEFIQGLKDLASQGGGNLLGSSQFIRRGGNAVNTASALLSLGLDPRVIVTTDQYGLSLLKALADPRLDLSHVHTDGRLSTTVSIETKHKDRDVNLMISDSGSASRFGFSDLTNHDLEVIRESSLVALVNLNHNRIGGELAKDLFDFVRSSANATTFIDIGDPSNNPSLLDTLLSDVVKHGLVDIMSVNENEVLWIADSIDSHHEAWRDQFDRPEKWLEAARFVSSELAIRLALHTPLFSAIIDGSETIGVPSFVIESQVACGAGDVWNAGLIYSILQEFADADCLLFANAVASLYVSSPKAKPPTIDDVLQFLISQPPVSDRGNKLLIR